MSYINSIRQKELVAFWSFEYDNNQSIEVLDEINNQNPLTIFGNGFDFEQPSIVENDRNNKSLLVGDYLPSVALGYRNSYLQCQAVGQLVLGKEYTIEFFYKQIERGDHSYKVDPILEVGDLRVYFYNNGSSLTFEWGTSLKAQPMPIDTPQMITITQRKATNTEYEFSIILNGRTIYRNLNDGNQFDFGEQHKLWRFLGNSNNNWITDYHTGKAIIDNISVSRKPSTPLEVGIRYKEAMNLTTITTNAGARYYTHFGEQQPNDTEVPNIINKDSLEVNTQISKYIFTSTPHDIIPQNAKLSGRNYITFKAPNNRYDQSPFNLAGDFTIWLEWKPNASDEQCIFSITNALTGRNGISLWQGIGGNQLKLKIDNKQYDINYNYIIDDWNKLAVTHDTSENIVTVTNGQSEMARIENVQPDGNECAFFIGTLLNSDIDTNYTGALGRFAYFNRIVDDIELVAMSTYDNYYIVKGYVRYLGNPEVARVIIFDYESGEKIIEGKSRAIDGEYYFHLADNRLVISTSIIENSDTPCFTHAPIYPEEVIR